MAGKLSAEDAWTILGLTIAGHRTQEHNDRLGATMRYLGWQRRAVKIGRHKKPGYVRGTKPYQQITVTRHHDQTIEVEYDFE
jgi:hypothetical protein